MNAEIPPGTVLPLRILLVDDFHPFRQTVGRMLTPFPSLNLIGEATDGLPAVEMAFALRPDIIVMDVQMPELDGIGATRRIKGTLPQVCVIGVSAIDHPTIHEAMLAAGASAFVGIRPLLSQTICLCTTRRAQGLSGC